MTTVTSPGWTWGIGIPGVACSGTVAPTLLSSGDDPETLAWGALGDNIALTEVEMKVPAVWNCWNAFLDRVNRNGPLTQDTVHNASIPIKIKIMTGIMNISQLPNG